MVWTVLSGTQPKSSPSWRIGPILICYSEELCVKLVICVTNNHVLHPQFVPRTMSKAVDALARTITKFPHMGGKLPHSPCRSCVIGSTACVFGILNCVELGLCPTLEVLDLCT